MRTFVGLAVVVAVIYGLAWVLAGQGLPRGARRGAGLATAATVPLGPNRSLHLVRAGRELVLVGVAEHGVTPIRTYTEEEARAAGLIRGGRRGRRRRRPGDPTSPPARRKTGLRKMTIGEALERIRQATVRA